MNKCKYFRWEIHLLQFNSAIDRIPDHNYSGPGYDRL